MSFARPNAVYQALHVLRAPRATFFRVMALACVFVLGWSGLGLTSSSVTLRLARVFPASQRLRGVLQHETTRRVTQAIAPALPRGKNDASLPLPAGHHGANDKAGAALHPLPTASPSMPRLMGSHTATVLVFGGIIMLFWGRVLSAAKNKRMFRRPRYALMAATGANARPSFAGSCLQPTACESPMTSAASKAPAAIQAPSRAFSAPPFSSSSKRSVALCASSQEEYFENDLVSVRRTRTSPSDDSEDSVDLSSDAPRLCVVLQDGSFHPLCAHEEELETDLYLDPREKRFSPPKHCPSPSPSPEGRCVHTTVCVRQSG